MGKACRRKTWKDWGQTELAQTTRIVSFVALAIKTTKASLPMFSFSTHIQISDRFLNRIPFLTKKKKKKAI